MPYFQAAAGVISVKYDGTDLSLKVADVEASVKANGNIYYMHYVNRCQSINRLTEKIAETITSKGRDVILCCCHILVGLILRKASDLIIGSTLVGCIDDVR